MKITMPITVTAADTESRVIAGRIVQWDAAGNTSAGRTQFAPNSITFSKDIKLVVEHQITKPIGKLKEWSQDETGITASFQLVKTQFASDMLEEAATGLRSDFSVGVEVDAWDNQDGTLVITSSKLVEVSLVTSGAIPGAEVQKVAAVDTEISEPSQEETKTETEGEQVSDTTVHEAPAAETVEAAKVEVKASTAPFIQTTVRNPIVDKASYLEHSVRAALGNDDSRLYVTSAANTTDNAGLVPTRQLTEDINPLANADRPFIDSISRGALPDAGMSFEIPKLTQVPSVAVTAEEAAPSEQDMTHGFVTVDVKRFAGQQTFSQEILDRSSPAFFAELVRNMEFAYAKATDAAVGTALIAGATDGGNRTMTAANLLDFISDAAVSIYTNSLAFGTEIVVSPEQWGAIMNLNLNGTPLYAATINPQNASGNLSPVSVRGNVLGLNLRVDRNLSGTGDNSIFIIEPNSYTWYESSRFQLATNLISTSQIQVEYYGYGAIATKVAAGAYKWMVA